MREIAWRGLCQKAPENTIAAFDKAVTAGKWFHFDLRMLADGTLVCLADTTLDRTTNLAGPVGEATYADIRRADAGAWFSPKFRFERIPELADVISFMNKCSGKGLCQVHEGGSGLISALAVGLEQLEGGRLLLTSDSPAVLAGLDSARLSVPLVYWAGSDWRGQLSACGGVLSEGGALSGIILDADQVDEQEAAAVRERGLDLYLFGATREKAERVAAKGLLS
ncbi:hypothetical protein CYJ19_03435 [Winkia neuii]|uniref:GP-PDE domain-containing protein n=1 Tax=Winkia neuii TaxID=33007 RepID=A0A2I1INL5_9ACTO|nr:glycerophosphodiester phosphodiesterase family protein [Winkia neuii]PKY72711.1 hypothetical protein CYJ19_03435 [Winkia neuii]